LSKPTLEEKPSKSNLKSYLLEFHVQVLKEWKKLDESIKAQFQKVLAKRLQDPRVTSAKLRGELQNA
jgi:mRNA interferase RelE/StbE